MKKVFKVVIWITLVITALVGLAALTAERCHEKEIIDDVVSELILSPQRDKYLVIQGDLITLRDAKTDQVLAKTGRKTREREITWYHGWVNNDELAVVMIDFKNNMHGIFSTQEFKQFTPLEVFGENIKTYNSPSYERMVFQNVNDNKIFIQYKNGEKWDTGLAFKMEGFSWSNSDKYLFLTQDDDAQYLLNTKMKKSIKINKFSGVWAPTKDLYGGVLSLFNPETLQFTQLNSEGIDIYNVTDFIWSPNSEYMLTNCCDELFISSVGEPDTAPRHLIKLEKDGYFCKDFAWTKDLKSVLGVYHKPTTLNFLKPIDYYAFKVEIATGKTKKIYLNGMPSGTMAWIDDDTLIYQDGLGRALVKAKLRW